MKSWRVLLALVMSVVMLTGSALADTVSGGGPFYWKGRDYSRYVGGFYVGSETIVLSAGALFGPYGNGTGGYGREEIRVWSRLGTVSTFFDQLYRNSCAFCFLQYAKVSRMDIRFYSNDSRRGNIFIDRANVLPQPQPVYNNPGIVDTIYDVLNIPGFPYGAVVRLLANGYEPYWLYHSSTTGTTYDLTVTVRDAISSYVTDLPSSYTYTQAEAYADEQAASGRTSGQAVIVPYNFLTRAENGYNLCLWPQAQIQYNISEVQWGLAWDHFYWTNTPSVPHYVNTTANKPFPSCP